MTKPFTAKQIIKAIGCDKLSFYRGAGYWYFVCDDQDNGGAYGSVSVYCAYLNQMPIEKWIEEGRDAIKTILTERSNHPEITSYEGKFWENS